MQKLGAAKIIECLDEPERQNRFRVFLLELRHYIRKLAFQSNMCTGTEG